MMLVELIVVILIISILMSVAAISMNGAKKSGSDQEIAASARVLWDGIQSYRLDHDGAMPPAGQLSYSLFRRDATSPAGGGSPYVEEWPVIQMNGAPLVVSVGPAGNPPLTVPAAVAVARPVQYYVVRPANAGPGAAMLAGYLISYGSRGDATFLRQVRPDEDFDIGVAGGSSTPLDGGDVIG